MSAAARTWIPASAGMTGKRSCVALLVLVVLAGCSAPEPTPPPARGNILIDDTHVHPESVTSTAAGDVITGSLKGIVFRAPAGESVARPWIRPSEENGLLAVFGVLAHDSSQTLWVCTVPNPFERAAEPPPSALVAFDLASGAFKASYPFPPPASACNDIAVADDGTVYATDTPNGRIFTLAPGEPTLQLFGEDEQLKGVDGLAFDGDGVLYVNIVSRGALLRVEVLPDGSMGELTELALSQSIAGPDGFRPIAANRFLLAEGSGGRIDEVIIEGDTATIRVLEEGLNSPPGVTLVGETAYAIEGKIGYLIDPSLQGQDPGAFEVHAIPLN